MLFSSGNNGKSDFASKILPGDLFYHATMDSISRSL